MSRKMLSAFALTAACAVLVCGALGAESSRSVVELQTADGPRRAIVLSAGSGPRPTILVLHAANGSGETISRRSGFAEAAAKHGFTAVFPSGLNDRWHYGPSVAATSADDVGFLRDLVARLVKDGVSDPKRLYIVGVSNGGLMTFKMLCASGQLFAGAATIIANFPAELEGCPLPQIPYVMVNGTADPMMPFAGGRIGLHQRAGRVLGAEQTATLLARADGCGTVPGSGTPIATDVTKLTWTGCKPGTFVTLFRVQNGGHTIPGTGPAMNPALGATNENLATADVVMNVLDGSP